MKSNVSMLKPAEIIPTEKLGKNPIPIHTWLIWQKPSDANFFTSQNSSVG